MASSPPSKEIDLADLLTHGGNLASARALYPQAPEPWIDLSTGISPYGYPVEDLSAEVWTRLPDAGALATLLQAARKAYGLQAGDGIAAASGSQPVLSHLPQLFGATVVEILGPTYSEHERSWRVSGAEVRVVGDLDAVGRPDVLVVVNPNNPDGRLIAPSALLAMAERLGEYGGRMVVDEAFMDFTPEASLFSLQRPDNALVLRSFGKAYGLAGLRLSFAVGQPDLVSALRARLGPWPVSGPAMTIGARALGDQDWLTDCRDKLAAAGTRLDQILLAADLETVGGTHLFRLVKHPQMESILLKLLSAGVLVRPFSHDPTLIRMGIPSSETQEIRLAKALISAAPTK
ncbi:threonine-phosphate decarboxylase CobD [Oryzibacter oryziterrae]|uniref:threonine-phosphate decarboxylase CobD n=1 Tax=Oryzibacter oryziterrae TaxID=2766474 RepID=UPI001F016CA2|nr:threonine-phosphate decarboxylase CobD [Oryzibacter oryziterrae]